MVNESSQKLQQADLPMTGRSCLFPFVPCFLVKSLFSGRSSCQAHPGASTNRSPTKKFRQIHNFSIALHCPDFDNRMKTQSILHSHLYYKWCNHAKTDTMSTPLNHPSEEQSHNGLAYISKQLLQSGFRDQRKRRYFCGRRGIQGENLSTQSAF